MFHYEQIEVNARIPVEEPEMKFSWAVVLLLLVGFAIPRTSAAQVSVYGDFSATKLQNLVSDDILYGATTGVLADVVTRKHLVASADIQGRFVYGDSESMDGVTVGPRFAIPLKHGFAPYGEFMVGFARFHGNAQSVYYNGTSQTTDSTIQLNGGLTKRLTPRFDAFGEFSYAEYFAYGGQYNPKTFSVGAVFHFTKR